jgi:ATP-dependent helicase HrpB
VVTRATLHALHDDTGNVLVFLPGAAEIGRVARRLGEEAVPPHVTVHALSGQLAPAEQDRAIAPAPPGQRKVVLATAVAETSLTIEGVRVVVDAGLMRVPRFSPRTGMTRLETLPVTQASADQRRGRAGRTGPGVCYRLWSEQEHAGRPVHGVPEIMQTDLAPVVLELALRGVTDAGELRWLDAPPAAAMAQARELLAALGAIDTGGITPHGRAMAELPVHPRVAHMLLTGAALGLATLACELAALLGDRDIVRSGHDEREADITIRLAALHSSGTPDRLRGQLVDRGALQRGRTEAQRLERLLSRTAGPPAMAADAAHSAGLLLAHAYPDRIARRRGSGRGRFLLRNGRGALLQPHDALAGEEFIVAADLEGGGRDSRVFLAAALDRAELEAHFAEQIERVRSVAWDDATDALRASTVERLGAIVLREREARDTPPAVLTAALCAVVRQRGLAFLPWTDDALRTRNRLAFLHTVDDAWPDVSDETLLDSLDEWLGPQLHDVRSAAALRRVDLAAALLTRLDWQQRARLDTLAPTHIEVPSGSRVPIRYDDPSAPVLAVRLQEIFGWKETPRIADGQVALTLHLLSPAHRPVQVTRDLASFWASGYFAVRRDLRGRYPRHYWPDDPLLAEPTRRAKPR